MGRPKTIYEEILAARQPRRLPSNLPPVIAAAVPGALLLLFRLICHNRGIVNTIVWRVTTPYKQLAARVCAHLPFNLAEVCWTLLVLGSLALVGNSVYVVLQSWQRKRAGKRTRPLRRLLRRGLMILALALWVYLGYTLLWGINYYADTFSDRSGLRGRETTAAELGTLLEQFADTCNALSGEVPRDSEGLYTDNWRENGLFRRARGEYEALYEEFPCLDLMERTARPMFYSRLMSALGFTGFYYPFTGESLVNVDAPYCLLPATILHELAHQRNVAMEDEANFLAIVAGLHSEDPEFRYSAALMGYIHLSNALHSADHARWKEIDGTLNDQVRTDLRFNNAFWKRHESPASSAAEGVYTSFARSYEQEDIMKSYGACVDLLAAYYLPGEGR